MAGGEKKRQGRPAATEPTPAQREILALLRDAARNAGPPPTIQELAGDLGKSYSTVREQLDRLERMGYLTRGSNRARSLQLTELAWRSATRRKRRRDGSRYLPLVERAPAGGELVVDEDKFEKMLVPEIFLDADEEGFFVRVEDDSMEPELRPGDIAVVRAAADTDCDQISVTRCGDSRETSDLTIRVCRSIEQGRIVLGALNPAYPDLEPAFVRILGVVVGLMRPIDSRAPLPPA